MPRPPIIAHHLIWTLYGHWLPNDPRGSGSIQLRQEKFLPLGPIHHGRKPDALQPSRVELRSFQHQAKPMLAHSRLWIDDKRRSHLTDSFDFIIKEKNYTVWACAILSNHVHAVVRKHRDSASEMWHHFAEAVRTKLRSLPDIACDHPIWSSRPYKVFLRTPKEIGSRVRYVERNPGKERLSPQKYAFVTPYDNWPFHKLR